MLIFDLFIPDFPLKRGTLLRLYGSVIAAGSTAQPDFSGGALSSRRNLEQNNDFQTNHLHYKPRA